MTKRVCSTSGQDSYIHFKTQDFAQK